MAGVAVSTMKTGQQSATDMASATPFSRVQRASVSGWQSGEETVTQTVLVPWTWVAYFHVGEPRGRARNSRGSLMWRVGCGVQRRVVTRCPTNPSADRAGKESSWPLSSAVVSDIVGRAVLCLSFCALAGSRLLH